MPESVGDQEIRTYLLSLFNTVAPLIPDIDWRLDKAHRSLAPNPLAGANPRDIIVCFHYYDSKEALTVATHSQTRLDFKDAKIKNFSDLSPITLAKCCSLCPVTAHLQNHKVTYRWGFFFRLSASRDGIQYSMQDLQESETFLRNLGLPISQKKTSLPYP